MKKIASCIWRTVMKVSMESRLSEQYVDGMNSVLAQHFLLCPVV